jgi:hypothetical protein
MVRFISQIYHSYCFIDVCSIRDVGQTGNLTIQLTYRGNPPNFYVNNNRLWLYNNETSIFHVNAVNITTRAGYHPVQGHPLQLSVNTKREGLMDGVWRWRGTMLYYDYGKYGNSGLYYLCTLNDGTKGVFMFLKP